MCYKFRRSKVRFQIATLNNRTVTLNNAVSQPNFDPTRLLDLGSYLDELENVYRADRTTLLTNLGICLAATSTGVMTDCAPIASTTLLCSLMGSRMAQSSQSWHSNPT